MKSRLSIAPISTILTFAEICLWGGTPCGHQIVFKERPSGQCSVSLPVATKHQPESLARGRFQSTRRYLGRSGQRNRPSAAFQERLNATEGRVAMEADVSVIVGEMIQKNELREVPDCEWKSPTIIPGAGVSRGFQAYGRRGVKAPFMCQKKIGPSAVAGSSLTTSNRGPITTHVGRRL